MFVDWYLASINNGTFDSVAYDGQAAGSTDKAIDAHDSDDGDDQAEVAVRRTASHPTARF